MAKVYVSSTLDDLKPEREWVMAWLTRANHQPVHSYVADTQTVVQACLKDVCRCDAYLLILGFRYGSIPADHNPEGYSITELEYRAAVRAGLPIVVLRAKGIRDIKLTDFGQPAYARVEAFARLVTARHTPADFGNDRELIEVLSTGLANVLKDDPLRDPDVQAQIGRLYLEREEKDAVLETQALVSLQEHFYRAYNSFLTAAEQPSASDLERNAALALKEGDVEEAEMLLLKRQADAEARAEAATDSASARTERQEAVQCALQRCALALGRDRTAALAAYEHAAENEPDAQLAWTPLFHLYITMRRWADAKRALDRVAKLEHRRAAVTERFKALR